MTQPSWHRPTSNLKKTPQQKSNVFCFAVVILVCKILHCSQSFIENMLEVTRIYTKRCSFTLHFMQKEN